MPAEVESVRLMAAAFTIVFGGMVPAFSIGWLTARAMQSLGRNPEAEPAIRVNLILAIAFCEAIAIYALVIAIAIKFIP